ncbi:MAG: glycosyltransferase family 39 protein, partial [Planctomycetota bacterium]
MLVSSDPVKKKKYGLFLILMLTLLTYFYPVYQSEFLNWDDNFYLTENTEIQSQNAFYSIWIENRMPMPNPYPLTFSLIHLQYRIFGMNSAAFHLVNLLLHCLNIVLFWKILKKLNVSDGVLFIATSAYALHPVQVETVMWMSEVKNLLSAFWYWISFWAFLIFLENGPKKKIAYALLWTSFTLSLSAKSMTVTLPISLTLWLLIFHRKCWIRRSFQLFPLWLT